MTRRGIRGMVMVRSRWLLRVHGMVRVSCASSFAEVRHHRSANDNGRECEREEATNHMQSQYIARLTRRVFA
jgi:hypothetical protein